MEPMTILLLAVITSLFLGWIATREGSPTLRAMSYAVMGCVIGMVVGTFLAFGFCGAGLGPWRYCGEITGLFNMFLTGILFGLVTGTVSGYIGYTKRFK